MENKSSLMHVTVCICTRNRGESIAVALRSVLNATYDDFDVVVVDQSASDETAEAVRRLAGDDPRVTYMRSNTVGSGVAHNIAVANARGPIVSFTDDDCEVCPDRLRLFARHFAENPDVGQIFGAVYAGPHDASASFVPDYPVPHFKRVTNPWLKWRERGIGANMAFRKEALEAAGPFDEVLGPGAPLYACLDGDMTYRVLRAGYTVLNVPDAYVIHHGFRPWAEGQRMMRRVGMGVGAAYMKHLRLGDLAVLPTLVAEGLRCIAWQRLLLARWRHVGFARFYGYLKGMAASFQYGIDRDTRTYHAPARPPSLQQDQGGTLMRPNAHDRQRTVMPRLLLLTTADDIGGMQRVVVSLAREFGKRRWPVLNVFSRSPKSDALLAWCRDQGVDALTDPAVLDAADRHTVRDMLALRRFIRARKPDVVNLHYGDNFISLKDLIAVRLAGRHHTVVTVNHPTEWHAGNTRKRVTTFLAALLSNAVVVISHATRDILREAGVPAHKIHLIPCGVAVPAHLPTRDEARARLGLPPDAFVIATLARLVPHKGVADLIEGAARLSDADETLVVAIAGEGPERRALEQVAAERLGSRAVFLGRVPDTADLYAAADVFALPSYMEGFGLVYIEAAFHGVPSIGTNVGGIPDAIADGETGLLVAPGDIDALTAAIARLRDDPCFRNRLGQTARARAYDEFTEECMAERYAKVLQP